MKRRTEQAAVWVVDYSDATAHAILPADGLVAVPRRTRH
jgi:hypothetical protein